MRRLLVWRRKDKVNRVLCVRNGRDVCSRDCGEIRMFLLVFASTYIRGLVCRE